MYNNLKYNFIATINYSSIYSLILHSKITGKDYSFINVNFYDIQVCVMFNLTFINK